MPDPEPPVTPSVVQAPGLTPASSRAVLVHTAICLVVLVLTGIACAHFNLPGVLTDALLTTVGLVLVATGLMDATSAANSKTLAVQLTAQLNEALKAVQMDVAAKHEVNAAAIAINEMDIKALAAHPVLEPPIPEISLDNPPKKE